MIRLLSNIFIFYIITILIYIIKVPVAYLNFYAEDGSLFFQEAKDMQFPLDFIEPAAGYFVLVSRIIGRAVSFFPIDILPAVNFLFVCFFIALICAATWQNIHNLIHNFYLKIFSCLSLLLLPIINFELLASSSSLHFLLLFPTALIFLKYRSNEKLTGLDLFIAVLGLLSDPTSILLVLILFDPKFVKNWSVIKGKVKVFYLTIFSCVAVQCVYITHSLGTGSRKLENTSSIPKTFYLYLDRVLGSALVPNWGFVSSIDFLDGILTQKLVIRATFTIVILCVLVYLIFRLVQHEKGKILVCSSRVKVATFLLLISIIYWAILGYLFNPEPRYAIFPGLCLVVLVLVIVDCLSSERSHNTVYFQMVSKYGVPSAACLISLTWVFSFYPSPTRMEGPTWESEVKLARDFCNNQEKESINLRILPKGWTVEVNCSDLRRN